MHRHICRNITCIFAAGLLWLLAACAQAAPPAGSLPKAKLLTQWLPQSQFAGYYVAQAKGMYRQYGVDVEIVDGGPGQDPLKKLANGEVQFATMFLTSALSRRSRQVPLVNIAQVVNRSNLMLVAWKDWRITTIRDLQGRRVSIWGGDFRVPYVGMFTDYGLKPIILQQNYSVDLFLRRGVDACSAMFYNEYHMLYQAGIDYEEVTPFFLRDLGCDFPEDGIYCLDGTLKGKPALCKAVAAASLEGWQYARKHPKEAVDIVMKRVYGTHIQTNRKHMEWMLTHILPSIIPGKNDRWQPGVLAPASYARAVALMKKQRLISTAPSYEQFCAERARHVP